MNPTVNKFATTDAYGRLQVPYMDEFEKYLLGEGLAPRTIKRHVMNATDFIYYMSTHAYEVDDECKEEELPIDEHLLARGGEFVDFYFGYFLPVKALATEDSLRQSSGSVKKLYKFLAAAGLVSESVRDEVLEEIKEGMELWLESCC